jgi:hypothetical protein
MKWRTCGAPAPTCHGPLQLLVMRRRDAASGLTLMVRQSRP